MKKHFHITIVLFTLLFTQILAISKPCTSSPKKLNSPDSYSILKSSNNSCEYGLQYESILDSADIDLEYEKALKIKVSPIINLSHQIKDFLNINQVESKKYFVHSLVKSPCKLFILNCIFRL